MTAKLWAGSASTTSIRQLRATSYDRFSAAELAELLGHLAAELRVKMGPTACIELDGLSFVRPIFKLLDPKYAPCFELTPPPPPPHHHHHHHHHHPHTHT